MITSAKYINFIVEAINVLRQELISKNKMGLTDENKILEDFVGQLLNLSFGYQLLNLNEEKKNFPGIDLGDINKGIGFQITATKTSEKINETLETIINHNINKEYPKIKIFIITEKQEKYSIDDTLALKLSFNHHTDILDFDNFYYKVLHLDLGIQKKISEYIHEQIPYVTKSIGIDYFSPNNLKRIVNEFKEEDWQSGELKIEHNFGYLPQVCVMKLDGTEVEVEKQSSEKFVTLKANSGFTGKVLLS